MAVTLFLGPLRHARRMALGPRKAQKAQKQDQVQTGFSQKQESISISLKLRTGRLGWVKASRTDPTFAHFAPFRGANIFRDPLVVFPKGSRVSS